MYGSAKQERVRPDMLPDPKVYITNLFKKRGEKWDRVGAYVLEMRSMPSGASRMAS